MDSDYKIYTDGGARGNPGPSGLGALLFMGDTLIDFDAKFVDHLTNNQAEYLALEVGLKMAQKNNVTNLSCFLDSELTVKQFKGEYKVKDQNLIQLKQKIDTLIDSFTSVNFFHVPRAENKFADKLVNLVLDSALR